MTNFGNVLVGADTPGERIRIEGRVFDGIGAPLRDVLLEIWQANAAGRYNPSRRDAQDKPIRHLSRLGTRRVRLRDRPVHVRDHQARPCRSPTGALMAPHVNFWIVARGINIGLTDAHVFLRRRGRKQCRSGARNVEPISGAAR